MFNVLLYIMKFLLFIAEKNLNLVAGLSYAFMGSCKICDCKFKLSLGGPIILECNTAGCFAQYICRKYTPN